MGDRDAARVRVVLHAHHGDAEFTQPDEDPGADLAEAEQHHMAGQAAWRAAQGGGRAERTEGLQDARDQEREQHQTGHAGEDLDDLAGRLLADRGVAHREEVEQGEVGGVQGVVAGGERGGDGEAQHGQADAQRRPAQPPREDLAERCAPAAHPGRRSGRPGLADRLQDHRAPARRGGHLPFVGQQPGALVAAAVGALGARRVVGGGGEQREGAQAGVGDLAAPGRGAFGGAQQQALRLDDLAGAGEDGGREGGGGGVGVGEDGGGGVQGGPVQAGRGDGGGLVEECLQVLAQLAVVEPDDQPEAGVEAAGGQRGADVALVVVVHQGQGGGRGDARLLERLVGRLRRRQDADRVDPGVGVVPQRVGPAAAAAVAGHRRRHPAEQRGRQTPSRQREFGGAGVAAGRQDEGDPLPVHVTQLDGEPHGPARRRRRRPCVR